MTRVIRRTVILATVAFFAAAGTAEAITHDQAVNRANAYLIASLGPAVGAAPAQQFNCERRSYGWSCGFRIRLSRDYCAEPWHYFVGAIGMNNSGTGRHYQRAGCERNA